MRRVWDSDAIKRSSDSSSYWFKTDPRPTPELASPVQQVSGT